MKIPGASAVLTGIALVAFISLVTFVTLFTGVAFVALVSVNTCGFHSRVGRSDPPVAVLADEGGVAVFAVNTVLTVKPLQNGKIVQVQPDFVAGETPLQGVFAYTELRCFPVCFVCAFLPGGACDVGYRHKVLPLAALIAPLDVGCGSLHLYVFGVHAVLAVNPVNTVFSVCTVYSVLAVGAILAVGSVLTGFPGSPPQLGKGHQVMPGGCIAVFPLDRRAVIAHLRQCGVAFCRFAPSYGQHDAK